LRFAAIGEEKYVSIGFRTFEIGLENPSLMVREIQFLSEKVTSRLKARNNDQKTKQLHTESDMDTDPHLPHFR